jgi:hypothetical protein
VQYGKLWAFKIALDGPGAFLRAARSKSLDIIKDVQVMVTPSGRERFPLEKKVNIGIDRRPPRRMGLIVVAVFVIIIISIIGVGRMLQKPLDVEYRVGWTFTLTGTEHIGGKYNASIEHFLIEKSNESFGYDEIVYQYNGTTARGMFVPTAIRTLDWIRNATASDSVFLCWWPYGHGIRGWAERDSIITSPSKDIEDTTYFPERVVKWESQARVKDVATALLTADLNETARVMSKYGAKYVMIDRDAITYTDALCKALDKRTEDYAVFENGTGYHFVGRGLECSACKFLNATCLPGFELAHEDGSFRVFRLTAG